MLAAMPSVDSPAMTVRDALIRQLTPLSGSADARPMPDRDGTVVALRHVADDLRARLGAEIGRRERLEHRLHDAAAARREWQTRALDAEATIAALTSELALLETDPTSAETPPALPQACVLCVGGRPGTIEQAREMLRRAGGELLSHDGGRHDHPSLLAGLIGRADRVVFPVDCISHDAALAVKRPCRQLGKSFSPLRSSGLASFLASLNETTSQPHAGADSRI